MSRRLGGLSRFCPRDDPLLVANAARTSSDNRRPRGRPVSEYTQPGPDFHYGAQDPEICVRLHEMHHSKHHATHVRGLNDAVTALEGRAQTAIFLNEKKQRFGDVVAQSR